MKKIFKKMYLLAITILMFLMSNNIVLAAGTATVGYEGPANTEVNKEITVTLYVGNVSSVPSGVVSVEGNLSFDSSYLQYVSGTAATSPYAFSINTGYNYKIAGMDNFLSNGITSKTTIFTFKFKTLKEGSTTIDFKNGILGDGNGNSVNTSVSKLTVNIGGAKSNDATLKSLTASVGTLSPNFASGTTSYTLDVPAGTSSVTLTGVANDTKASVSGNGSVNLNGESTTKTITVTAEDGTTKKNYTVTIKKPSSDATLKSLTASTGTLSPSFASGTTSYTLTVPSGTSSVTLTGAANNAGAAVSGNGPVALNGDSTTHKITVTAPDNTKKEYTITINKSSGGSSGGGGNGGDVNPPATKSSDANLKGLRVDGYDINPGFSNDILEYNVTVPNDASEVNVIPTLNDTKAKYTISGNKNLTVGDNRVTVKVTAEDGSTKEYIINVKKEAESNNDVTKKDSDATLKSLEAVGYTINPNFNSKTTSYSISVPNNVTDIDINAIPNSDKATVSISGNTGLKAGMNVIRVKVTAESGATNTYTINVNKASASSPTTGTTTKKSSDNYLKSLDVGSLANMKPSFSKEVSNYNITVPYEVDKLDLEYIKSDKKAQVKITGNSNFQVGKENIVEVEVTAEDGSVRIYTLNVVRESQASKTDLDKLIINGHDLVPAFNPDTLKYTVNVDGKTDKLDITALAKDKDSKVEILNNENLKEGKNTVLVKVTDKNGYTKYYEIEVNKESAKKGYILGLPPILFWPLLLLALGLLGFIIFLLIKRSKDKDETSITNNRLEQQAPVIEFKPEFNFGSKNTSDDDVVHGNFNQDSEIEYKGNSEPAKLIEANIKEVPYVSDETITKDEIVDAIREAVKTKDTKRLRDLLDQDERNQERKKRVREQNHYDDY